MSLLLDARKKSQAGDNGGSGSEPDAQNQRTAASVGTALPDATPQNNFLSGAGQARRAGQNLFGAKSLPAPSFAGINRNLLFALAGTVILLAAGGGYVWYITSAGSNAPVRPVAQPPAPAPVMQQAPAAAELPPKSASAPEVISPAPARTKRKTQTAHAATRLPSAHAEGSAPPQVERHQAEPIDPLLNSAYQAYREGRFDQAQQLYMEALKLDERNADALLGLAVIAQRRGADDVAANYYAKVLTLNPRDPVANAGMSALTTSDTTESRLKTLLHEQPDSPALHFALGNVYSGQGRWADAQRSYFNAFRLVPTDAASAFQLAVSLEHLGQRKLAARYYQSALQLDPSNSAGFDHGKISQRIEELSR